MGAVWTQRAVPGAAPSSVGRSVAVVFICAAAVLMTSVAANAKSSGRSSAKSSAATKAPALDAQAINAAQYWRAVGQRPRPRSLRRARPRS